MEDNTSAHFQDSLAVADKSQTTGFYAIVPCAGVGSRAMATNASQQRIPKQYANLKGMPLVAYTLRALLQVDTLAKVVVVLSPEDALYDTMLPEALLADTRVVFAKVGGASRAESVRNGLQHLLKSGASNADWVLVHDAARCLVQPDWVMHLITEVCSQANKQVNEQVSNQELNGGLLAVPLADTLKQAGAENRVQSTLSRADKWLAQTPQMFRLDALLQALQQPLESITDEASAIEAMGGQPLLVRGHSHNFKVTFPEDFLLAEAILAQRDATL